MARSRGSSVGRCRGDQPAVAQHGDAIGDAVDLVHAMADEHHRHALPPQIVDHGEQPLDLALRQGGRGLVHDQHARVDRQRAGDLDQLLLGAAQRSEPRLGRHVEADRRRAARAPASMARVVEPPRRSRGMWPMKMFSATLRSGNRPGCWCMTAMPAAWASSGEWNVDRLAVEHDMPVGRAIDAGQQLDAGALAGAVLAQQRQHLAGAQFERRILEGNRAAEGLCGVNQGNGDSHVRHHRGIGFAIRLQLQHLLLPGLSSFFILLY